ncbi:RagB/SusD family nutrient uptake outer membrane protein [Danxiaibacter flavus]|uniref:RagB/SusD family nutrient uptake outer membrane protein n=1 Tax=Danxiaibacter flavus TaxID=3049108 RepID=A0ABV3Z8Q9_9BACT|nr:RagB/SusD family nutrient uptake outer membrane protein [Chitinophagaceae bacterium DXS]
MKKTIIFLLASAVFIGCKKDFLNTAPLDAYSNTTLWKSQNDALAALNGCYSGWEYGDNVVYDDCITDNAYDQFPWEGYETFASGLSTPSNPGINKYDYTTIQRCNWFLDNIENVTANIDATIKERMKAEARFLRAYRYFILSQNYGDVPFVEHAISPAEANSIKQTPKATITDFVLAELQAIAPALPVSYTGSDIGRITRGAALALKARIELFNGKYAECIATTRQLMTSPFSYSLYPNYGEMFRPQNADNREVILDAQYLVNTNSAWVLIVLAPNSFGGWSSVAPTQSLIDSYETINGKTIQQDPSYNPAQPYSNRDPRLEASIIRPASFYMNTYFDPLSSGSPDARGNNNASPTGYNFKKYIQNLDDFNGTSYGSGDISNTGQTFIVIRYAEVLLTYAEAKIEANQIDQSVYNAINTVRNRVGMPSVTSAMYPDQTSLRTLVRRERRVELAGEGLRWYDVQRWKIATTAMSGNVYGCPDGTVNTSTGALTITPNTNINIGSREFKDKNYLWPIPQKEIDINKDLIQNKDY